MAGDWVFGCDICQMVCPWNRFAAPEGDPDLTPRDDRYHPLLNQELELTPEEFNRKFKNSPIQRAKRRGYLRNVSVVLGNEGKTGDIPELEKALKDAEPLVREHAAWAIERITQRHLNHE